MRKFWKILLIVFFAVLILGTFAFLAFKGMKKKVVYKTAVMTVGKIEKKTIATGKILPRKEIAIKPQSISGIVEKLFVDEGEMVKKGDRIAKISVVPNEANLNSARNSVQTAKLNYENAKRNYDRNAALYKKDVLSAVDFEKSKLEYDNAKQALSSARSNLQIIRTGALSSSRTANTIIRSTINGMVLDIPVKEGNSVIASNNFNDGTSVALIADMGEMIFEGKVDETEVAKLNEGMNIQLTIGALREEKFPATIEHIAPKGIEEQGAVQFEIKAKVLLEKDQFIRAGFSANADIVVESKDSINIIKESYIGFDDDSAFVEVLTQEDPQKFEKKFIKTGISDGVNIEIMEGIDKEDKIKTGEILKKEKKENNKKKDKEKEKDDDDGSGEEATETGDETEEKEE